LPLDISLDSQCPCQKVTGFSILESATRPKEPNAKWTFTSTQLLSSEEP
jgi:hypothetical protein